MTTNGNTRNGDDTGRPAPHCPICRTEMVLTSEERNGELHPVWVCPNLDQHPPPPSGRWWSEPPFAAP